MYYVVLVLFVWLDGWVFHRLFREACQRDLLDQAISTILPEIRATVWTLPCSQARKRKWESISIILPAVWTLLFRKR